VFNDGEKASTYAEEPIEIEELTDLAALWKMPTRPPMPEEDEGRKPRYRPNTWVALHLKPGDKPQTFNVALRRK
jgi:hypothetical protein